MSGSALPKLDTHHPSDFRLLSEFHTQYDRIVSDGYIPSDREFAFRCIPSDTFRYLQIDRLPQFAAHGLASERKLNLNDYNDYINKLFEVKMVGKFE